jgi:hypothetical protein
MQDTTATRLRPVRAASTILRTAGADPRPEIGEYEELRRRWCGILCEYTQRDLTHAKDKLVAFAAIAEVFHRIWGGEYLADEACSMTSFGIEIPLRILNHHRVYILDQEHTVLPPGVGLRLTATSSVPTVMNLRGSRFNSASSIAASS